MEQGRIVLKMLKERTQLFSRLKDLLYQQQNALVKNETDKVRNLAEQQLSCMEQIYKVETRWNSLVKNLKKKLNHPEAAVENVISYILEAKSLALAIDDLNKLTELAKDIDTLKRNNALLLHNSITLIRNTLSYLQGNKPTDVFYNPRRKTNYKNAILNKKL